jgi:hypothetical protein
MTNLQTKLISIAQPSFPTLPSPCKSDAYRPPLLTSFPFCKSVARGFGVHCTVFCNFDASYGTLPAYASAHERDSTLAVDQTSRTLPALQQQTPDQEATQSPDKEQIIEAARSCLKHMRWDEHQCLLVSHNDTQHLQCEQMDDFETTRLVPR